MERGQLKMRLVTQIDRKVYQYIGENEYDLYCSNLEAILSKSLTEEHTFIQGLHKSLDKIANDLGEPKEKLVDALKSKKVYDILSSVGFSITKLYKLFFDVIRLIRFGVIDALRDLERSGKLDSLKKGTIKMDDLLNEYPQLKKLTGPLMGALLLFLWIRQSFIGDPEYDFNMGYILDAVKGKYSLYQLFVSPEGLFDLLLVATGGWMSFSWLLATEIEGIIMALIYTGLREHDSTKNTIKRVLGV